MAKTFIVSGLDEVAFAFKSSAPAIPSRSAADARRGSSPSAAAGHLSPGSDKARDTGDVGASPVSLRLIKGENR